MEPKWPQNDSKLDLIGSIEPLSCFDGFSAGNIIQEVPQGWRLNHIVKIEQVTLIITSTKKAQLVL